MCSLSLPHQRQDLLNRQIPSCDSPYFYLTRISVSKGLNFACKKILPTFALSYLSTVLHIECESSLPDRKLAIRLFEYDAQIALDEGVVTEETLTVTFPHTAVLYLRSYQKTPDKMKYVIVTPGGMVQYDVPIMKVQAYSLNDIFEKRLLMLIPFYIFSHEKRFPEYNKNEQKLEELKEEYQVILKKLDEQEQKGVIGAFDKRTIIDLSSDVIKEIAQKYENVQKGVGDMMRGAMIEIAECLELSVEDVEQIAAVQIVQ